jgi:hypothetical protein
MPSIFDLMDKAHETYSFARSRSNKTERQRLLAEADNYLKQAEEMRRSQLTQASNQALGDFAQDGSDRW